MAAKSVRVKNARQSRFDYLDSVNKSGSSDSSDSDEVEDKSEKVNKSDVSFITKPEGDTNNGEKTLPSPEELFRTAAEKPDFLRDKTKADIEWSKFVKNTTVPEESEPSISDGHNVPPPTSYEPNSAPLKPTLGFQSLEATKRKANDDSDGDEADPDGGKQNECSEALESGSDTKRMKFF